MIFLVCSNQLGRNLFGGYFAGWKERLFCCALQGGDGMWICSVLRLVHPPRSRPLLKGCFNPFLFFLIFILPVWVSLHFMDKLVRFMSPVFLLCIFSLLLIIYL